MSEFNDLKKLWKSADGQILMNESLDFKTVKRAIKKQSTQITAKFLGSYRIGILALSLNVILYSFNINGYAGNNLISIFCIFGLILSTILLLFLVYQFKRFNKLERDGLSLHDLIVAKIKYFEQSLSFVHHTIAISIVLLALSLNLIIDNNGGNYQVNNIWVYICIIIIAYLIQLIMLNLSHNLYLRQYKIALHDLNESKLSDMNARFKKYKWAKRFFLIIILLSFIAGIIIFFLKISGH